MEFLRSGGTIIKVKLTSKEKKAMEAEVLRQLAEYTRKYQVELESIFLRHQRSKHGFGAKRLRQDFDDFGNELDELVKRLEMGQEDKAWLATYTLKEEGFDIEQWHREKYPNEGNFA